MDYYKKYLKYKKKYLDLQKLLGGTKRIYEKEKEEEEDNDYDDDNSEFKKIRLEFIPIFPTINTEL